jgi:hypothetical protein
VPISPGRFDRYVAWRNSVDPNGAAPARQQDDPRDLRVGDGDPRCESTALTVAEHEDAVGVDIGSHSQGLHCGNRVWNVLVGCGKGRGVNRRRKTRPIGEPILLAATCAWCSVSRASRCHAISASRNDSEMLSCANDTYPAPTRPGSRPHSRGTVGAALPRSEWCSIATLHGQRSSGVKSSSLTKLRPCRLNIQTTSVYEIESPQLTIERLTSAAHHPEWVMEHDPSGATLGRVEG